MRDSMLGSGLGFMLFVIVGFLSTSFASILDAYIETNAAAAAAEKPLWDIVHRTTDVNKWKRLSRFVEPVIWQIIAISWFSMYSIQKIDKALCVYALLHACRILCFLVTILPPSGVTELTLWSSGG